MSVENSLPNRIKLPELSENPSEKELRDVLEILKKIRDKLQRADNSIVECEQFETCFLDNCTKHPAPTEGCIQSGILNSHIKIITLKLERLLEKQS